MEGHIYHWKHGWIPLDHLAAMIKAKGSHSGADRLAKRYGIAENRTAAERRLAERTPKGSVGPTERGGFQYKRGTQTKDYPQRKPATAAPTGAGPKSAAEAFKMKKADLAPHAKAGNPHAQAELERRAAKHAGKPAPAPKAAPKAPKADRTEAEVEAESRAIERTLGDGSIIGSTHVPGYGWAHHHADASGARLGSVIEMDGHKFQVSSNSSARPELDGKEFDTRLEAHRALAGAKAPETSKSAPRLGPAPEGTAGHLLEKSKDNPEAFAGHKATLYGAATGRAYDVKIKKVYGAGNEAPSVEHEDGTFKAAKVRVVFTNLATGENGERYYAGHEKVDLHAEAPKPANPFTPDAKTAREAEDRQIEKSLPVGHSVRATGMASGGTYSRHYDAEGNTLGTVSGSGLPGSKWRAEHNVVKAGKRYEYTRKPLGEFDTREEGHKAIADAAAAQKLADAEKAAKAKAAAARKSSKLAGLAGPHGTTWEPHTPEPDGTFTGRIAAAKVKQAFKAGNHTVTIESAMSEETTKGFLSDVTRSIERAAPNLKGTGVSFLVPTGDGHFRQTSKGVVGAYVHVGGTTVHVNPNVANGKLAEQFAAGAHRGHFMPAGKTNAREYTLVHELGHVVDGVHQHTRSAGILGSFDSSVTSHHRENVPAHSKYGKGNAAEGYAEAFAQWSIGGAGSHQVSDSYAAKFGWHAPGTPAAVSAAGLTNAIHTSGS